MTYLIDDDRLYSQTIALWDFISLKLIIFFLLDLIKRIKCIYIYKKKCKIKIKEKFFKNNWKLLITT